MQQNGFKKCYKRAVKRCAVAVTNLGCSGKSFDSDKQCFCSGAENSRIMICTAEWLQSGFEKTKNVVTGIKWPTMATGYLYEILWPD